jgi:hypothetical protein
MYTSDKDQLGKTIIKHRGKIDVEKLYSAMKNWFIEHEYDYTEKNHTETLKAHGDEIRLEMNGEREITPYIAFYIELDAFSPYIKKGSTTSSIRILVKPVLELDYRGYFNKNSFTKFLKFIYNNYIFKIRLQKHYETKIYLEFLDLSSTIKEVLGQYD